MRTNLIRPSYLVSVKSTITGGISYKRVDFGKENEEGTETARWETTRIIDDKEEHERATQVRGKAVSLIRRVCYHTAFGLICPLDKGDEFDEAVKTAREVVDEFNADAACSRVGIYVLKGEIAATDEEAVRSLSAEVFVMVEEMQSGIDKLDVNEIRAVAKRARLVAATLGDDQSKMLSDAIVQARAAATTIIKRVKVAGESAEAVLAEIQRNDLEKARAAFLDYSEGADVEAVPAVDAQRFADLEVEDDEEVEETCLDCGAPVPCECPQSYVGVDEDENAESEANDAV